MQGLALPEYKKTIVSEKGYNSDIIKALNDRFPQAVEQTKNVTFSGSSLYEKGRAIYNYIRGRVQYRKDDPGKQIIQLPSRLILDTKKGDCKSKALAAAAFMYNNGFRNIRLRYTGYSATDNTPTHVYAVGADESGRDIIIDPVYRQYNAEVPYQSKKDYQMQISVLSGPPVRQERAVTMVKQSSPKRKLNLRELANKVIASGRLKPNTLAYTATKNFLIRAEGAKTMDYPDATLLRYRMKLEKRLPEVKNPFVARMMAEEINLIKNRNWRGVLANLNESESSEISGLRDEIEIGFLKKLRKGIKKATKKISLRKIVRGVKTVGLIVPRKAFLAMVSLNVRGIAKRLSMLSESEIKKIWEQRFGGKYSVLKKAISKGKKKRSLFGSSKKVKSIKGIGYVVDESNSGIGEPVSTAAIIAAAAPILVAFVALLKKKGIPEDTSGSGGGVPGESGNFPEADGQAQEQKGPLNNFIDNAVEIARATGIIPDKPMNSTEKQVDDAIPGDDFTDVESQTAANSGASFKINPLLLVGAAGAAFLLMKKK